MTPSGWLGNGRRGSFSSGSYCTQAPNASRRPGILHTASFLCSEFQRNKRGRRVRLLSAATLLAFQTKPLNQMCLLNPVCPFHCEFLEAQVSAGLRKGRSEVPWPAYVVPWCWSRNCVGRAGLSVVLPGGIPWSPICPDDLAGQMERVGSGMCCPAKAAPEGVC